MNYLSLFTGAGGGDLGMQHLLGFRCRGYVEYEPYCQEVIKARIKDGLLDAAPIFGDIRAFVSEGYAESYQGMVDLITGGFPCQPFSVAGKQRGGNDPRNMWPATIEALRIVRPRYAFLENVPGLLATRYFGRILGDLAESGFDARWKVISAAEVGAPHKRDRLWIMADSKGLRWRKGEWNKPSNWNGLWSRLQSIAFSEPPSNYYDNVRSDFIRIIDDVPNRVDRLKALGNGQVPLVAATAFRILSGGFI